MTQGGKGSSVSAHKPPQRVSSVSMVNVSCGSAMLLDYLNCDMLSDSRVLVSREEEDTRACFYTAAELQS